MPPDPEFTILRTIVPYISKLSKLYLFIPLQTRRSVGKFRAHNLRSLFSWVYFYFIVLKLRKQMGEELAVEILADLVGNTPVPGPACPVCGKEMRYTGEHGLGLESRAGAMEYERGSYAFPVCDEGFFPLDDQLGVKDKH